MARIVSFSVDGLAGRDGVYSKRLNRDVNVFFGINGSGKTTLLKILHSALSADVSILKGLPFRSAEVEVYLNRHESIFKRRVEQAEAEKTLAPVELGKTSPLPDFLETPPILKRPKWTSDPEEPQGPRLTVYHEGFLPITRLYRSVGTKTSGTKAISEEELDARFADAVQRIWADYNAEISSEISEAQQEGLANILHFVLSGGEPESEDETAPSVDEAYKRVSAFLTRQGQDLFAYVLDSPAEFGKKYETTPQIRGVVREIDRIENRIEVVTAPKFRLQRLLESMYTGKKRIVLTEKEIQLEISDGSKLGLPSLSSGEKQLFFICLTALQSGNHSLIVDEPELSMHVDWQRKLVASLRELNANMQLIMATHSPEIMADLPDIQVFSL
jgi:ABC-type cobalamin/Fe3+-siderophores transport system ATPase subunit